MCKSNQNTPCPEKGATLRVLLPVTLPNVNDNKQRPCHDTQSAMSWRLVCRDMALYTHCTYSLFVAVLRDRLLH